MSATQTIKRSRALSSACRTAQTGSRLVHSSSVNQATALSAASLAGGEPQEIILQPIFDIFDAPSTLAESSQYIRNKYSSGSASASTSSASTSSSQSSSSSRPRGAPAPLPQPVIFDGPARPTNGMLAFQSRLRDAGLRTTPSSTQPRFAPSSARAFSSSEPLVQMFDGPARITRYHHQGSSRGNESNSTKYMVALGVAGVVGCASIANNTEESTSSQRS